MKRALSKKNLWEASPPVVKAIVGKALRMVPIRYLLGMDFVRWYEFLQDAQWWDTERIRDYQLKRLKRILALAYESTEYYRESFRSVGFEPGDFKELSDLAGLPTINRDTVRANLHRMLTKSADHRTVDYCTTSGTGGNPLAFHMDSTRHAPEFAHLAGSWARVGYRPGMPMAVLRGELEQLARDLGIAHRVHFAGFQRDVGKWLRRSKLFVLTSRSEGLSLALMEAMMCGLPAVVSHVGDLGDLVKGGVNGYLVGDGSIETFASYIADLLTGATKYAEFSRAARREALRYETRAAAHLWDCSLTDIGLGARPPRSASA